jgi:hypothetical protein
MANPETIINKIRQDCTEVFMVLQANLGPVLQDSTDFPGSFFTNWFAGATNYDVTLADVIAAVAAMQAIKVVFDAQRAKLQVVRTR